MGRLSMLLWKTTAFIANFNISNDAITSAIQSLLDWYYVGFDDFIRHFSCYLRGRYLRGHRR
jgi:hypothetical protein